MPVTPAAGISLQYTPGSGFSVNGQSGYPSLLSQSAKTTWQLALSGTATAGNISVADPSGTSQTIAVTSGETSTAVATAIATAFASDTNYVVTSNGSNVTFVAQPHVSVPNTYSVTRSSGITFTTSPISLSTQSLTVSTPTGGASAAGTLTVQDPSGTTEQVSVSSGDSASTIATNIQAKFASDANYTVTNSGDAVTFTAKVPASGTAYATPTQNPIITDAGSTGVTFSGVALPEDFEVGVINGNAGATTLTVSSGSVSSTAAINFNGQTPSQVASFSPGSGVVNAGGSQTLQFQVQDLNGNPVPNSATNIETDYSVNDPFWITAVNGVTLQETLNLGTTSQNNFTTVASPIPLGAIPSELNYSVSIPGVVMWSNGNKNTSESDPITVYSDSQGNVTLTLQAGGLTYDTQSPSATVNNTVYLPGQVPSAYQSVSAVGLSSGLNYWPSGTVGFYSYTGSETTSSIPMYVLTSSSAPASSYSLPNGLTGSLLGQLSW